MRSISSTLGLLLLLGITFSRSAVAEPPDFDHLIAPLIARRCLSCHIGHEPKGGLDLSTRDSAMTGGDSGKVIQAGHPDESLLWDYVFSDEMPPKKPLSDAEKTLLQSWIASGAKWGTEKIDPFRFTTEHRAGGDWWSLQPLPSPSPPKIEPADWDDAKNPIDAFVYARLYAAGLTPSIEADRRSLIRRLSFDLMGLPPTPDEIHAFLEDKSANAYENLVDRLLASPHYGEHWARHWLDVIRFGESNGFEYDQPRNNAWPYRNWVINSLNNDLPYDEFVRLQLAGDVLRPKSIDAAAAVGFLVAGPHNTTLPANEPMRMTMAQDELEDLVGVIGQTFLGLTVNCARCHDHKFDPISQKEYYQLAALLSGVRHGERTIQVKLRKDDQQRRSNIEERLVRIEVELDAIEQPIRNSILSVRKSGQSTGSRPPHALATWEFDGDHIGRYQEKRGTLNAKANGGARVEDGSLIVGGKPAYVATQPLSVDLGEKTLEAWVTLDNLDQRGGGVLTVQSLDGLRFDAIVFGEREPKKWMAGSNGFVRTKSFTGIEEREAEKRSIHFAIVYREDGTIFGYRDGMPYGKPYHSGTLQRFKSGDVQILFGMRHSPVGGNRMLAGRIHRAQLYDRALTAGEIETSFAAGDLNFVSESELLEKLTPEQRQSREMLVDEAQKLNIEKEAIQKSQRQTLYTCVPQNPGITRVLRRGNVTDPTDEVAPAGLSAVTGVQADFQLAANASDADRRRKLAEWITHKENPLFARVIVNRLWHYHFGQGLVTTPSDFGFNGGTPSHPELLDWLAQQLVRNEYSLKSLHRLIVTSATYRQSSTTNAKAVRLDVDNRLLWRRTPKRLSAEEIRDAVLVATGKLNAHVGGKGYRDVRHFSFKGSNFYESVAETSLGAKRRTIYRFTPRGGRNPFLDTFDCPDPSTSTPQRATTTTPLQALALMNNELIFEMTDEFAERVTRKSGDNLAAQIRRVYLIAYAREANDDEVAFASPFVAKYGLPAFCRVVLNSNEFLYLR